MSAVSLDDIRADGTMTPEELAAIQDGEEQISPDDREALSKIAGNADDDGDDSDDDGEGEVLDEHGRPVATEAVIAAKQHSPEPETGTDTAAAETKVEAPAPTAQAAYNATLPENYQEQMAVLDAKYADLRQKFRDGEIDVDQYEAERKEADVLREAMASQRLKAEISLEMNQQAQINSIKAQNDAFVARTAKDGIDYKSDANVAEFDTFYKVLRQHNPDKDRAWVLDQAHARMMALRGLTPAKSADEKKVDRRTTPLADAPKTLAQVPGGDGPGDISGEFANLDALEGTALEDALAKMSPAQREKYAALM